MHGNRRRFAPLVAGFLLVAPLVAGCASETTDKTGDAVESARDDVSTGADEAQARSIVEALRASIKGNATADEKGVRSVAALQEAADDLPGDPAISGIDDADGDGLDDDGKVQANVGGSAACLTLPATGEDTTVKGGAC